MKARKCSPDPRIKRARLVASRIVKVEHNYNGGWAVTINGWHIRGYDTIKTKTEAIEAREQVTNHFEWDLFHAGVRP